MIFIHIPTTVTQWLQYQLDELVEDTYNFYWAVNTYLLQRVLHYAEPDVNVAALVDDIMIDFDLDYIQQQLLMDYWSTIYEHVAPILTKIHREQTIASIEVLFLPDSPHVRALSVKTLK